MSVVDELRTWIWVVPYWIVAYSIAIATSIGISTIATTSAFWIAYLVVVPLLTIPIIYRNLVGGFCSVRFRICALVKGTAVGMMFFVVSMLVDPFVWSILQPSLGWNALALGGFTTAIYQIWFYSGFIGGFAARIVEVRTFNQSSQNITIAGFEEVQ